MFKPLMAHENNIKSGRHYNEMSFNIEFIADTVTKFTKIIFIINNSHGYNFLLKRCD